MTQAQKIELLAPAGNLEKLRTAIHYGADAVYLSGKAHSLRTHAGNFGLDEMREAVRLAHQAGVRVYVAVNAFARPDEMAPLRTYLTALREIRPDALIVADPGVIRLAGDILPEIPIHLSTQANTTNPASARFWKDHGVTRINAARELSLSEIRAISADGGLEVEAFVHGAMCIAYSGRCLLSSYMTERHSNQGQCAHPCRWRYAVVEEQRPGQYMPVTEDAGGTYIFNSKDLCMIDHLPEMIGAGIASLKIEGRQKGINYLAAAVKTYRAAIDTYYQSPAEYRVRPQWKKELAPITPRPYCTGFYLGDPDAVLADYKNPGPVASCRFAGIIRAVSGPNSGPESNPSSGPDSGPESGPEMDQLRVAVRNRIRIGDTLDILTRNGSPAVYTVRGIQTMAGEGLQTAQAGMEVLLRCGPLHHLLPNDIVRTIASPALPACGKMNG